MEKYLFLLDPALDRAYLGSNRAVPLYELAALAGHAGAELGDAELCSLSGADCVSFRAEGLSMEALGELGRLSGCMAAFIEYENGLLRPLERPKTRLFPDSMVSMQKYSGKTNEFFTRLLVNLALSALEASHKGRLSLLDPLCGRGTTLYEGAISGFNVTGVEQNPQNFVQSRTFMTKYLELGKYKHKLTQNKVSENGKKLGDVFTLDFAADKAAFRAEDTQRLQFICADTCRAAAFVKKASFDILVTDLPYGVQHGSRGEAGLSRSPFDLLKKALPVWASLLKPGAAAAVSFNTHTSPRAKLSELFSAAGFKVLPTPDYSHRVDNAIVRDLIVAVLASK